MLNYQNVYRPAWIAVFSVILLGDFYSTGTPIARGFIAAPAIGVDTSQNSAVPAAVEEVESFIQVDVSGDRFRYDQNIILGFWPSSSILTIQGTNASGFAVFSFQVSILNGPSPLTPGEYSFSDEFTRINGGLVTPSPGGHWYRYDRDRAGPPVGRLVLTKVMLGPSGTIEGSLEVQVNELSFETQQNLGVRSLECQFAVNRCVPSVLEFGASLEATGDWIPPQDAQMLTNRLLAAGEDVPRRVGAVADGASRLWVYARGGSGCGAGASRFELGGTRSGTLSTPDLLESGGSVSAQYGVSGNERYAWCLYTPPEAFDRDQTDYTAASRQVDVAFQDEHVTLDLHRPSVVLVAGLGGEGRWGSVWEGAAATGFPLWPFEFVGSQPIAQSAAELQAYVDDWVRWNYQARLIACEKVDLVGYSTGGVVIRTMLDHGGEQRCRRLVTIGTPHWGSDLANCLMAIRCRVASAAERSRVDRIVRGLLVDPAGGSIGDVQEGGLAVEALNATAVPGRALVGTSDGFGVTGFLVDAIGVALLGHDADDIVGIQEPLLSKAKAVVSRTITANTLFDQDLADGVVQACSAHGWNSSRRYFSGVGHLSQPTDVQVADEVFRTLRLADTGELGFFPAASSRDCLHKNEAIEGCEPSTSKRSGEDEELLKIRVIPAVARRGESVTMTVELQQGFSPSELALGFVELMEPQSAPPYERTMVIPADFQGASVRAMAYGRDAEGRFGSSIVEVGVLPSGDVNQVNAEPSTVRAPFPGFRLPIQVVGTFTGGKTEKVRGETQGVTYESKDLAVADVTDDGVLVAKGTGSTTVVVRFGELSDTIRVEVPTSGWGACEAEGQPCFMVGREESCRGQFHAGVICGGLTPIHLSSLEARRTGNEVKLRWVVGSEWGRFSVFRGRSEADRTEVNGEITAVRHECEFLDAGAPPTQVKYWLREILPTGGSLWHGPVEVSDIGVSAMLAVGPVPARSEARAVYRLNISGLVRLSVHDVQGRLVRVLVEESVQAGVHTATWDIRNAEGRPNANGTYFVRLEVNKVLVETAKAVVAR